MGSWYYGIFDIGSLRIYYEQSLEMETSRKTYASPRMLLFFDMYLRRSAQLYYGVAFSSTS